VRRALYSHSIPPDHPLAHIATVGKAFASSEENAYPLLQKHDVSYVLVLLGSLIQYSGDDLNKFLWMIRIASGVWPDEIREPDFFTSRGEFRVDDQATKTMSESLMYKMSYYRCVMVHCEKRNDLSPHYLRFQELFGPGQAQDRVRNQKLPAVGPTLDYFGELLIV
jgi:dolichyl-diphosphooligosaccharide--protein glycosyltransferase